MVKAILNGTCLAETDSPIQVEGVQVRRYSCERASVILTLD